MCASNNNDESLLLSKINIETRKLKLAEIVDTLRTTKKLLLQIIFRDL